jgi:hypothetical protein
MWPFGRAVGLPEQCPDANPRSAVGHNAGSRPGGSRIRIMWGGGASEVLASPEIAALVSELEATRWTGRPGYPIRGMIGMALAKSIYAVPT